MVPFRFRHRWIFDLLDLFRSRPRADALQPDNDPAAEIKHANDYTQTARISHPAEADIPGLRPTADQKIQTPTIGQTPVEGLIQFGGSLNLLDAYLANQGNFAEDIAKLRNILQMAHVILDIGCGNCEVVWEIALKNPGTGVIATDKFDWAIPPEDCSHYQKVAQAWKDKNLKVQQCPPENMVVLRAEAEILRYMPDQRIDSILLVNPEPNVGKAFVEYLAGTGLHRKIKPGEKQIVIKPFSREMGVISCGGYEFEHSADWSRGLGFLLGTSLVFRKAAHIQWSVDLSVASPYSKNSTQTDVYVFGISAQKQEQSVRENLIEPIPGAFAPGTKPKPRA